MTFEVCAGMLFQYGRPLVVKRVTMTSKTRQPIWSAINYLMTAVKFPAPECLLATQISFHSAVSQRYPFFPSTPTVSIAGSCYNFTSHCARMAFSLFGLSSTAFQRFDSLWLFRGIVSC